MEKYVINPNTKHFVKMGTPYYFQLLKNGVVFDKSYNVKNSTNKNKYALNPKSNQLVQVSSRVYKKLLKEGVVFEKFYDSKNCKFICVAAECNKEGRYAENINDREHYCGSHKKSGMVDFTQSTCTYTSCKKNTCYGLEGESPTRCASHKTEDMVNRRKCKTKNCYTAASYGYNKIEYCVDHKKHDMKILKKEYKCIFKNCDKNAHYGLPGEKREWCRNHKKENMVNNFKPYPCFSYECSKNAYYGYLGEKPTACLTHCTEKMILINGSCQELGCNFSASYGLPDKPSTHCSGHKSDQMIPKNISKKCLDKNCGKIAIYGYIDGKNTFCKDHKLIGMIVDNKCSDINCEKSACYGFVGAKKIYCGEHKLPSMIDLNHRKCDGENCTNNAYYNIPGKIATKCSSHKTEGMINMPRKKCIECKNNIALYGSIKNKHQERCEDHKLEDDINYIERKCISCGLDNILNIDNKCYYCDDTINKKRHLFKQKEVIDYLTRNNLPPDRVDRQLEDGTICDLRSRPDIIYDCGTHYIVLEIDEHQHDSYPCQCEINRMINITQVIGMKTIFIRYNPDSFKSNSKEPSKIGRLKILKDELEYYIKNVQNDILTVKYLFYDHYKYFEETVHTIYL